MRANCVGFDEKVFAAIESNRVHAVKLEEPTGSG